MSDLTHASPLERIESRLFANQTLWIKRDDLLHPVVSGNKHRKLKYALPFTKHDSALTVVSMGGPWSNHLHALAYACRQRGLTSIGLIRGLRRPHDPLTATLQDCIDAGMTLKFVSREDYRLLRDLPNFWQNLLHIDPTNHFWLPEGGSSVAALQGVAEVVEEITCDLGSQADVIVCPCGTGASMAGIVAGMRGQGHVIGIAAIQNANFLDAKVQDLLAESDLPAYQNYEIFTEFDHGGFAKTSPALLEFCDAFMAETKIPIEHVYTGKMLYAVAQLCHRGQFKPSQKIVLIHTGGLQGARGLTSRSL